MLLTVTVAPACMSKVPVILMFTELTVTAKGLCVSEEPESMVKSPSRKICRVVAIVSPASFRMSTLPPLATVVAIVRFAVKEAFPPRVREEKLIAARVLAARTLTLAAGAMVTGLPAPGMPLGLQFPGVPQLLFTPPTQVKGSSLVLLDPMRA